MDDTPAQKKTARNLQALYRKNSADLYQTEDMVDKEKEKRVKNMPSRRHMYNIFSFTHSGNPRHSQSISLSEPEKKARPSKNKLHPAVRRRRLVWLGTMIVIICWSIIELIIQQGRIWEKEEQLAAKKKELQAVQAETHALKAEIKKLGNEDYLLELAHKLGYSKPGEEIYEIKP